MKWWLLLIIIPGLVLFSKLWLNRPFYHRGVSKEDFHRFFKAFIKQSSDRSLLFIELEKSNRFVQFAKYTTSESGIIISFGFPEAPWSKEYIGPIIGVLKSSAIDYKLQAVGTDPEYATKFIDVDHKVVDIEKTAKECADLAVLIFQVMGAGENATYTIHHEGGIDPSAARSSVEELLDKVKAKRMQKKGRMRQPNFPNKRSR